MSFKFPTATFLLHLGGKLEITAKNPIKTRDDISMLYTPGVSRIVEKIVENLDDAYNLTIKKNTVAVVTDGSEVLGLGAAGPARGAAGFGSQSDFAQRVRGR